METRGINIAYFTADWSRELVSDALNAVAKYLKGHDGVHVQVFDCFTYALYSETHTNKYQIYELPDLTCYDAVLVQGHEIVDSDVLRRLGERIERASLPAISIGAKVEGCLYIGTDDYNASRDITAHLIEAHGAGSFLYLKGMEREDGRGEAEARRKGFEDVCRAHGIPAEKITYFDGAWESRKGKQAIEELLASGAPLPDAVVSANDEMALGAMGALTDAGYRIPQDIMVVGYDDIQSSSLSDPRLSTISRDFSSLIATALDSLLARLRGEDVAPVIYSPHKAVCSESCGCYENAILELPRIKKRFYAYSRELERFYFQQDQLTADLFAAEGLEILDRMERHSQIFGGGRFYIFIDEAYFDRYQGSEEPVESAGAFSDHFVLAAFSGEEARCDRDHVYMRIGRRELTTAAFLRDEQMVVFYPIYLKNTTLGFLGLTQPPTVAEMQLHENIVNLFVIAMENARQRQRSERLNATLNRLYMTDPLTGLYNRFGYERLAEEIYGEICSRGAVIHVLFLDIDDMKEINDRYGHEYGDMAIQAVSQVMRDSCRKSDFKMRYGGDEFVIITEGGQADLKGRLEKNFEKLNESGELAFPLRVSIGDCLAPADEGTSLEELLRRADELMYLEKQERKHA